VVTIAFAAVLLRVLAWGVEPAADLARTLLSEGNLDSALRTVDSALASDTIDLELLVIKAAIHAARGESTRRIASLRAALNRFPSYPDARLAMAWAFVDSGLTDSAAAYLPPHLLRQGPLQIQAQYVQGRIFESAGMSDSAVGMYKSAYESLDRRELLWIPVSPGEKLNSSRLLSAEGGAAVWRPGIPSIFVFWAIWSPSSLEAFGEIVTNLKRSGIKWRFMPINVDDPNPAPDTRTKILQQARALGYKDTVWIDDKLSLSQSWHLNCIPTVLVTSLNGEIEVAEEGWSGRVRNLIVDRYLGSYKDTVQSPLPAPAPERTRSLYLIAAANAAGEAGNLEQAVKQSTKAVTADPAFALAHVALAVWRWSRGDTLGARMAANDALRADSASPWACLAVARIENLHGNKQSAFDLMTKNLIQDTAFVPGWRLLGSVAATLNKTATASDALRRIEALNKLDWAIPVLRALIAETDEPERAAAAWRLAVEARL